MGVLYDYFAAPTDDEAAAVIDRLGGPGKASTPAPPKGRGLFGRGRKPDTPDDASTTYPTVTDTGIDPAVQGGTLEELLTGRAYEQIEEDPRWAQSLAVRDGGERLVLTLTDGLVNALAQASGERLAEVAVPWSETEEFWDAGDPDALASQLVDLATLCRDARSRSDRVYCWVSV